jgi:hypothetical protein
MVIKKALATTGFTAGRLYDFDHFSDSVGDIELARLLLPVCLVDPTAPDIPQVFNGANLKTEVRPREPQLVLQETLTWGGAAGIQYTSGISSSGYKRLLMLTEQTWTVAPAALQQHLYHSNDGGTTWFQNQYYIPFASSVGNGVTLSTLIACDPFNHDGGACLYGENAPTYRIGLNGTVNAVDGTVEVTIYGSD